ncbi:MAG: GNAT family N-acetyltransferase [Clostridia bacterium]|nr:GNAT family N-acetyltransferase [Clostridia bacterium]
MLYPTTTITLKNGRQATFRSPRKEDAAELLNYLRQTAEETDFVLRYPDEITMTVEQEESFIERINQSTNNYMILCLVDGRHAGNCSMQFHDKRKVRHRGEVAIALVKEFWGMGIGTFMFEEMIRIAQEQGKTQLELGMVDGNERGLALYRKMGFREYGRLPNAFHLKDGSMRDEILMVREL